MLWKSSPSLKTMVGKHVLITGGSCGIGIAIAKEALSQGAFVTLIARSSAILEKAIDELVDNKKINADRIYTKYLQYAVSVYAATKSGLKGLGEALRLELKPYNIGVSVIYPGYVETPMLDERGLVDNKEILKMLKVITLYERSQAETSEKVDKCTLEAVKNGTFLVTTQIIFLVISTLSCGFIPADSIRRAFFELVLYVPLRIFSFVAAIYFEIVQCAFK